MPVIVSQTPNPNALKFTVVRPSPPRSRSWPANTDDPVAGPLLAIPGVTSVFMSADFVTISKSPDAYWDEIVPEVVGVLEITYG
jgi:hypothetical protein